ncbi:MAG: hypothetical protein LC792_08795 [Actinobacteria bacterium]|nr:hypothetical protein [Actinomycetota bacterium]
MQNLRKLCTVWPPLKRLPDGTAEIKRMFVVPKPYATGGPCQPPILPVHDPTPNSFDSTGGAVVVAVEVAVDVATTGEVVVGLGADRGSL